MGLRPILAAAHLMRVTKQPVLKLMLCAECDSAATRSSVLPLLLDCKPKGRVAYTAGIVFLLFADTAVPAT
jgi:hypothetical protein